MALELPNWLRNGVYRSLHLLAGQGDGIRVILLYHSVGGGAPQSLDSSDFDRQLQSLAERFRVVPLARLPEATRAASPEENLAAVTFDDGLRDNYENALPLLERHGVKATFYVSTGYLGGRFPTYSGEMPMMTAAQIEELASMGHDIGAHTVTHPKLTQLNLVRAREEIVGSKKFLEDLLGREVPSFAYPKGDYDQRVRDEAESAGFASAVTIEEQLVAERPDWLTLPRVWIGNRLSHGAFVAKTSRALQWHARLQRTLTG